MVECEKANFLEENQARQAVVCQVCSGTLSPEIFPCPRRCLEQLCCIECVVEHSEQWCELGSWPVPRFVEVFSGPHAPLSCAVAQALVAVAPPYDVLRGSPDFFSDEGKQVLADWADDEFTAAEHIAPDCALMSRARGKPIRLEDGSVVKGPQQVRDAVHPLGFPWIEDEYMIWRVRRSNEMFIFALSRLQWRLDNWGFCSIEHPF